MKTRRFSINVSKEIGKVSAELITPAKPIAVLTLAHGAGASMHHEFMFAISKTLAEKNIATLRFNFPFMENKKGRPDTPAVAHKTIESAVKTARKLFTDLPLFISGKSFGGRMSSQWLATADAVNVIDDMDVKGIIFFGFPLHAPGKHSIERAEHLKSVTVPMLFLQGSRDELASYDLIKKVCRALPLATLIKIEGANHAFKAGKKEVIPLLADAVNSWISLQTK